MPQAYIPPLTNVNRGTLNPNQFTRTGSPYTNPDFLKLYIAQLDNQAYNTLFGDEDQLNNAIFGEGSVFGTTPASTSDLFGGLGSATTNPTDISGALTSTGGSQYLQMIAQSNLIGKTVQALDPTTRQPFTGRVNSVSVENGILLLDVGGKKIPPENLIKITE